MQHKIEDLDFIKFVFDEFYSIGTIDGKVMRLGYTEKEDSMHDKFTSIAKNMGFDFISDEVGNTYVKNSDANDYILIGSHLDSVVDGGRYDGVSGVVAGLLILKWCQEDNINLPIRIGAFRCEESSNFGVCTIGSGLVTGHLNNLSPDLTSKDGITIKEIFNQKKYNLNPKKISGVKEYLELHIEQGKVLEEMGCKVGIVTNIAGHQRISITIEGLAEHSGATPMNMRNDSLCAASEIVLAIEKFGQMEMHNDIVATVGVIDNYPNVMNVIPGFSKIIIDIRGAKMHPINSLLDKIIDFTRDIEEKRNVKINVLNISKMMPVSMDKNVIKSLEKIAKKLSINYKIMMSGAGHDSMEFADICRTGMVFIPCEKGISHNNLENISFESICVGAKVIYEYIKEEHKTIN